MPFHGFIFRHFCCSFSCEKCSNTAFLRIYRCQSFDQKSEILVRKRQKPAIPLTLFPEPVTQNAVLVTPFKGKKDKNTVDIELLTKSTPTVNRECRSKVFNFFTTVKLLKCQFRIFQPTIGISVFFIGFKYPYNRDFSIFIGIVIRKSMLAFPLKFNTLRTASGGVRN